MSTIKTMKTQRVFAPITRVDAATRVVEGYCYVNAVVGDGIDLTRKSMVKASEDYMKWGAIRAMHGPVAAGTAEAVTWDDKGCFLRAKITDDAEWEKCANGTYKGFSVGVNPVVMRGNKTVSVKWVENSLVDRPFDEDASFLIARAEGLTEGSGTEDIEVTVLDEGEEPAGKKRAKGKGAKSAKAAKVKPAEGDSDRAAAPKLLRAAITALDADFDDLPTESGYPASELAVMRVKLKRINKMADKMAKAQKAVKATAPIARFDTPGDVVPAPVVAAVVAAKMDALDMKALITRMSTMEKQNASTLSSLAETRRELKAEKKRVKKLSRAAAPATNRPVQFPGMDREFAANGFSLDGEAAASQIPALTAEWKRLSETLAADPDQAKRFEGARQMSILSAKLSELGAPVQ